MSDDTKIAIERLVRRLNARDSIHWQPEFELGKPLFDRLVAHVRADDLTPHQIANALVIVHRLRSHATDEDVFSLLLGTLSHSSVRVRDQAVKLVIGAMRIHEWKEPFYTPENVTRLQETVTRGVTKDVAMLVQTLVDVGPKAWH